MQPSDKSILVVDDEEIVRNMLVEALREAGHTAHSACGRLEVIDSLERTRFDLVITDVIMPEFDGVEVIRVVRALQPGTALIAMSGGGEYMSRELCAKVTKLYGAVSFIEKPVALAELFLRVEQAFSGSRSTV